MKPHLTVLECPWKASISSSEWAEPGVNSLSVSGVTYSGTQECQPHGTTPILLPYSYYTGGNFILALWQRNRSGTLAREILLLWFIVCTVFMARGFHHILLITLVLLSSAEGRDWSPELQTTHDSNIMTLWKTTVVHKRTVNKTGNLPHSMRLRKGWMSADLSEVVWGRGV